MRKAAGGWTSDQYDELGLGRFGYHPRLRQRQCTVEKWCPQCRSGWRCWSYFESREQAEACYWDNRSALMADELPGNRPLGFWMFEAERHCRHDPPCALPGRTPDISRVRRGWLDRHDLLTDRERVMLAMTGPGRDDGRLDDDDDE